MAEEEKVFRWRRRMMTTNMAERLVQEEGITPEEAVNRVLDVTEDVAYINRDMLTDRRIKNFVRRVGEQRQYKNFDREVPVIALLNDGIKEKVKAGELTELQATVFSVTVRLMEDAEGDLSTVTAEGIAKYMFMKVERVRGFLSAIRRKGLLRTESVETDKGKDTVYLLTGEGKDLIAEDAKTEAN